MSERRKRAKVYAEIIKEQHRKTRTPIDTIDLVDALVSFADEEVWQALAETKRPLIPDHRKKQ